MGGQGDGASYTINLDTSAHTVEETAPGNYRIPTLSPTIDVPYAAVPTVMLTQASFTNTLTTISRSLYNNNTVDLQWNAYSGEFGGASLFATYYERLALSDGYYNSFALEVELAKTAYATNKDSYDKVGQGIFPNFHTLQLAQTVNIGGASAHDILQVQSGASALMVGRPVTVPGAKTAYVLSVDESTQKITLSGQLQPSASNTTAVAGTSVTIGSGEKLWAALNRGAHTPPERMQLTVAANVAKGANKIQVRWPYPVINEALLELATIETVNGVGLPSDASIASFTTVSGTIATKDLVLQLTLAGTDVALAAIAEDELVQVEQVDNTQVGYGLKGVAAPIISANSDWGGAVKIFELQSVAAAMFREGDDPSSAIPETPANGIPATTKQANRYAQPFYVSQDAQSGHFVFLTALPSLRVLPTSTAIVELLGFDSAAAIKGGGALTSWLNAQSPFDNDGKLWHATLTGKLGVPRSLEVHVPGIVQASYDRNGKQVGAQVASIPLAGAEQNSIVSYVAPTMAQIPCALHGSNIEQVEFYLTADGRPIDLQGGVFSATLVISWPDPGVPQAGSAGAYDVIANAQNVYRR